MNLKTYDWWGTGEKEPPPELKTKKQLAELGFKPLEPVGVIETKKYDLFLYDPKNPASAKPKRKASAKQLAVLAANREKAQKRRDYEEWLRSYGFIESDRVYAVKWAREILEKDFCILDTETTGLDNAEIVEIAIINQEETPLLNTLVKPNCTIPPDAIAIHEITNEMVADAPALPEIWQVISDAIAGRHLLIYNAAFDVKILNYCRKLHNLPKLGLKRELVHCTMEWYSQWCGEWSNYYNDYKWQPLNGGHRALEDCLATLSCFKRMAEDTPEIKYPEGIEPPENTTK